MFRRPEIALKTRPFWQRRAKSKSDIPQGVGLAVWVDGLMLLSPALA
jgi:hypothetical protein